MGILSGSGGVSNFERLLESATSQLQLEPNWATILELCDSVRQKDVTAKYAVAAIRKKMQDKNPHVVKFALVTLEACMKNCGGPIHDEVATRDCMDELRNLANVGSEPVKQQTLSMVQTWNQTLGKKTSYKVIQDTYNILRAEGHSFPQLQESEAMYCAEMAPEWAEGDVCHQCRVKFSTFTRQHHCRCCGQVFCAKCSSKNSIIPKFGIEREVRVCDSCYDTINPSGTIPKRKAMSDGETQSFSSDDLPPEYLNSSLAKEAQTKPQPSEAELKAQEEEELQLAMALSLSAAEVEQQPKKNWSNTTLSSSQSSTQSSSLYSKPKSNLYSDVVADSSRVKESSTSNEVMRYLNRQYWEKVKDRGNAEPSAPVVHEVEDLQRADVYEKEEADESTDEVTEESDAFVETMSKSIEMFMIRMQTVMSKGKHIAMDSTVQSLFQSLSAMHPQLMKLIEDEEDNKAKYQAMLEKIALIRDARESLDGMRNQHREKLRHQELEQEMLRRMQMEQKLELMRQQKQEYLEYQRQLQIQRQQELEAQQQMKFQQKQMQLQAGAYANRQLAMQAQMSQGQEGFVPSSQYQQAPMSQGSQTLQGSPMHYTGQFGQAPVSYGPMTDAAAVAQSQAMPPQGIKVGPSQTQSHLQQQSQFDDQPYRQPFSQEQGQPIRNVTSQTQPVQRQFAPQVSPQHPPQHPPQQHVPQQVAKQPPHSMQQPIQQPPQPTTKRPSTVPDLLDGPDLLEVGMPESRSQNYGYQQPQQPYSQLQQQQQPIHYSQQPQVQPQQQPPQQQFASSNQQQPQSLVYSQSVTQVGMQQQQQYHQPANSSAPLSAQAPHTSPPQVYQQSSNRGQSSAQFQVGQDQYRQQQYQGNAPAHHTKSVMHDGPQSLQYIAQDSMNSQFAGPASLPANLNQYQGGGQSMMHNNQPYGHQNIYQQQQRQEAQMTESMKDLQLISFE